MCDNIIVQDICQQPSTERNEFKSLTSAGSKRLRRHSSLGRRDFLRRVARSRIRHAADNRPA